LLPVTGKALRREFVGTPPTWWHDGGIVKTKRASRLLAFLKLNFAKKYNFLPDRINNQIKSTAI